MLWRLDSLQNEKTLPKCDFCFTAKWKLLKQFVQNVELRQAAAQGGAGLRSNDVTDTAIGSTPCSSPVWERAVFCLILRFWTTVNRQPTLSRHFTPTILLLPLCPLPPTALLPPPAALSPPPATLPPPPAIFLKSVHFWVKLSALFSSSRLDSCKIFPALRLSSSFFSF